MVYRWFAICAFTFASTLALTWDSRQEFVIGMISDSKNTDGPEQNEKRIIEAERSSDRAVFQKLLADDSITIGPDGRRRTKVETIAIIHSIPAQNVTASDFVVLPAGRDASIVNYTVDAVLPSGVKRRHTATSIWVRRQNAWRMLFHQGTEVSSN
jgi:hypothetical protein